MLYGQEETQPPPPHTWPLETPSPRKIRKQTSLRVFPGCWAPAPCHRANGEPRRGRTDGQARGAPDSQHPHRWGLWGGVLPSLTLSLFSPASFFGDSFVEMPLADASRTVRLHLQLYTSQGSGLLFLAAGQPDHLLLQLQAGTLQVSTPAPPHRLGSMGQGFIQCKNEGAAPASSSPQGQIQARTAKLSRPLPGDVKSLRGEWTQSWENQLNTEEQAPAGKLLTHCLV